MALEFDKDKPDHYHILVEGRPDLAPLDIAIGIKRYVTYHVFHSKDRHIRSQAEYIFYKCGRIFSEGTFICTCGDASTETIKNYIDSQG